MQSTAIAPQQAYPSANVIAAGLGRGRSGYFSKYSHQGVFRYAMLGQHAAPDGVRAGFDI
jgi:hypothetical protein